MKIDLFKRAKVIPFTKYLSEKYPGKWKWNRRARQWEHEDGNMYVGRYAQWAPRHEGDDETFVTIYILHYRDHSKNSERVY